MDLGGEVVVGEVAGGDNFEVVAGGYGDVYQGDNQEGDDPVWGQDGGFEEGGEDIEFSDEAGGQRHAHKAEDADGQSGGEGGVLAAEAVEVGELLDFVVVFFHKGQDGEGAEGG